MERTLDPAVISRALGVHSQLPRPDELADMLANLEVALLAQGTADIEALLPSAWYLHGIASTRESIELYATERRRAAFAVSAHIFDLALQYRSQADPVKRLEWTFAAQIAYLQSELDPNALALFAREAATMLIQEPDVADHDYLSLSLAVAVIAADANYLFPLLDELRFVEEALFEDSNSEFSESPFAATFGAVRAIRHLIVFLVYEMWSDSVMPAGRLRRRLTNRLRNSIGPAAGCARTC